MVIEPGQGLRIGVSASLSGGTASVGEDIRDAVILAAEDLGKDILGFPLTVVAEDDGCTDAERAVAAANEFVADPSVVAVVGPMCSNGARAANPVYERAGLLHISASASMPALTDEGSKVFFRTVWRDDRQGTALAAYALEALGARTAVTVDDGGAYAGAVADAFAGVFQARGGALAAREKIAGGQTDFSALVGRIQAAAPDAVLFAGFAPEAALFLQQLRGAAYLGALLAPDSLFDVDGFVAAAGAAAEGALVLGSPPPPEDLAVAFQERFGREARTPFIGHAYDAAAVLLTAIDAVAAEEDGRLIIDRAGLLEALRAQVLSGRSGRIRFDSRGDRVGVSPEEMGLALYAVKGGVFVLAGERAEATATATPTATAIP